MRMCGLPAVAVGIFLVTAGTAFAVSPQNMNFQGRLTDASGNPLTGSQSVTFSVWDAVSAGNQIWTETQNVSVSSGIYNVGLGSQLALSTAVFAASARWLQIQVGSDAAMTPRLPFRTVPFALWSEMAEGLMSKLPLSDLFNLTPTNVTVNSTGYTVPAGKNFIALSIDKSGEGGCNGITTDYGGNFIFTDWFNCYIKVSGAHSGTTLFGAASHTNPFIVGPGDVISSTGTQISFGVRGVLVPASVPVVVQDVGMGGNYTNSSSSDLYFGMLATQAACAGNVNIGGFTTAISVSKGQGGVLLAGQAVTNNTNCMLTLDGYLR